jgi:Tol biopolymer transport system component
MKARLCPLLASLLLSASLAVSQGARVLTLDDIFQYRTVSDPQISSDGTQVLYVTSVRDLKENVQNTDIWKVAAAGGSPIQLTHSPKSDASPRWSPDGKWIAFISDRSGKNQIYLMNAAGGEAEALTTQKEGVNSFDWSPDGKRIAFTGLEPRSEDEEKKITDRWTPRVVDEDWRYAALWVFDLESKKAMQITKGKLQVNSFDWSPDGTRIAKNRTRRMYTQCRQPAGRFGN